MKRLRLVLASVSVVLVLTTWTLAPWGGRSGAADSRGPGTRSRGPLSLDPRTSASGSKSLSSITIPVVPPMGATDPSAMHSTTLRISKYAVSTLRTTALSFQSEFVQTVTGATYTSLGFLESLQGAIAKMPGWLTSATEQGPLERVATTYSRGNYGNIQVAATGYAPAVSVAVNPMGGYWLAAANGVLQEGGSAGALSFSGPHPSPITDVVATPSGTGLYRLSANGQVSVSGDAVNHGGVVNILRKEIADYGTAPSNSVGLTWGYPIPYAVGMIVAPGAAGYLILTDQGEVIPVGHVSSRGEVAPPHNRYRPPRFFIPEVAIAATPDGQGYWIFSQSGHVYHFGDAVNYGAPPTPPNSFGPVPSTKVVAAAITHDGKGYWLFTADGTVFPFGDAVNYGSLPQMESSGQLSRVPTNIVAAAATPDGLGYYMLGADGTVYPFGDAHA